MTTSARRKLSRVCTALCLIMPAACAKAQGPDSCSGDTEAVLRQFGGPAPIEGDLVAAHCKPWPPSNGKVMAAVMAFRLPETSEVRKIWEVSAVVALLDARKNRVLHGRRFTIGEDAATDVGPESLVLDTANYAVSPGVRALGLRYHNDARPPSAPDAWWNDELTLFIPAGKSLVPIFCLPMFAQEAEVGAISFRSSGAVWKNAKLTLAMGAPSPAGWNDLILTETLTRNGAEDAKFDPTPLRTRYVYRNDDHGYRLPKGPTPFWQGYGCGGRP